MEALGNICVERQFVDGRELDFDICQINSFLPRLEISGAQREPVYSVCLIDFRGTATLAANLPTTNITHLNLSFTNLTDESLLPISQHLSFTFLESLILTDNKLTHLGVESLCAAIAESPLLRSLNLSSNNIEDKGGAHIAKVLRLSHLEELLMSDCNIGYKTIRDLSFVIPETRLRILKIGENPRIGANGLMVFAKGLFGSLIEELHAPCVRGHDSGVSAIAGVIVRASESRKSVLRVLDFRDNQITNDGAAALAAMLRCNCMVETLLLSENEIMDHGVEALADALPQSKLVELAVEMNKSDVAGEAALKHAFQLTKKLRTVKISWGNIRL
ncbi:hypothetical protein HDU83_003778 [Entophlyctis luteolus]|nr:hypothetical protein HDU83_003778 [Entophlyctis luteolus]